jgi:hypothetical protein
MTLSPEREAEIRAGAAQGDAYRYTTDADRDAMCLLLAEVERLAAEVDAVAARGAAAVTAMGADVRAARGERDRYRLAWQSARHRADVLSREIDRRVETAASIAVGDELVRCSGLHCLNTEFYGRLDARGWRSGGMGTWLCPDCKPTTKEG